MMRCDSDTVAFGILLMNLKEYAANNLSEAPPPADIRPCAQWSDQPRMHGDEVRAE